MGYKILKYSKDRAKELNVKIKPSSNPKKKIDVYKDGIKIATIGDINYMDYPTYLLEDKQLAENRRKMYWIRHKKDINVPHSNGYYAANILW